MNQAALSQSVPAKPSFLFVPQKYITKDGEELTMLMETLFYKPVHSSVRRVDPPKRSPASEAKARTPAKAAIHKLSLVYAKSSPHGGSGGKNQCSSSNGSTQGSFASGVATAIPTQQKKAGKPHAGFMVKGISKTARAGDVERSAVPGTLNPPLLRTFSVFPEAIPRKCRIKFVTPLLRQRSGASFERLIPVELTGLHREGTVVSDTEVPLAALTQMPTRPLVVTSRIRRRPLPLSLLSLKGDRIKTGVGAKPDLNVKLLRGKNTIALHPNCEDTAAPAAAAGGDNKFEEKWILNMVKKERACFSQPRNLQKVSIKIPAICHDAAVD